MARTTGPLSIEPVPSQGEEQAVRADERQRIAREIHDSTSQALVVLQLQLGRLRRMNRPDAEHIIEECEQAIVAIRDQLRTLGSG